MFQPRLPPRHQGRGPLHQKQRLTLEPLPTPVGLDRIKADKATRQHGPGQGCPACRFSQ